MPNFRSKAAFQLIANSISVKQRPWPLKRLMFAGNHFEQFRIFTTSHGGLQHSSLESLQQQIVGALQTGERSKASSLLSELSRTNKALKASDFVLILQKCAKLPDPLFALETWKLMKNNHIEAVGKCYFYTVEALSKGGYLQEAFSLMNLLVEKPHIYPLLPAYNKFLSASLQTGSINYANDCLDRMEQHMMGKSEITYAELLKLAVLQGNLPAVREIWNECINLYSLSLISLRKFVWSFTMLRDVRSAYVALQHMVFVALQRNCVLKKTFEGKLSDSRLDIPIPSCKKNINLESSKQNYGILLYHHDSKDEHGSNGDYSLDPGIGIGPGVIVGGPDKKVLRWSFSDVIHACSNTGDYILAEQLMSQMQNIGVEPSSGTYEGYLRAVVRARGVLDGVEVIKVMRQKNMMPYDSTLAFMSVSCSHGLELDLAEIFLEKISKCPTLHPYNALLEACDVLDQPERAIRVLAKMRKSNIQADIRTYELMFSLLGNVNAQYEKGNTLSHMLVSKRINAIEMDMMKNDVPHSHLSFMNLTKALGREGMVHELIRYLNLAESPYSSLYKFLGSSTYNTVLHSISDSKHVPAALQVFRAMKQCGISPDAETYNIMIHCCRTNNCFKAAYAMVSMMIRDGFNPDGTTYTILIKILFKLRRHREALQMFNKGVLDGIEPDIVLYNTIINVLHIERRVEDMELILEQMHRKKIKPDSSTCRLVFCAYLNWGRVYNTAMEALQVLSLRMISDNDYNNIIIGEKQKEFEDLINSEDYRTERKLIRGIFKQGNENDLDLALFYLRWCAMSGSSISWLPNQSKWAIRLAHHFDTRTILVNNNGQKTRLLQLSLNYKPRKFGQNHFSGSRVTTFYRPIYPIKTKLRRVTKFNRKTVKHRKTNHSGSCAQLAGLF